MCEQERCYIAIDLKSFYASVECRERGLNPLTSNLVVADESRTQKTICLAVSPSLKAYGIPGRARLFEVIEKVRMANVYRKQALGARDFNGESIDSCELAADPSKKLSFIAARPRMSLYMKYSTDIYGIYLNYVAAEDIHVYSVDEVFMDVTDYLASYGLSPRQLAKKMIDHVFRETGITATAGIGTNMYLAKIAMDIVAKHIEADEQGVRIAELDEMSYRRKLWTHRPLTDFWRLGPGYRKKLENIGIYTMGDIAMCSVQNEEVLYKLFGVNAELLIDHAWGYEPARISDIKSYAPSNHSISHGQVLKGPYEYDKALLVIKEMADSLALDLVDKGLRTDQLVLTVGYDIENLMDPELEKKYQDQDLIQIDRYGRKVPKQAHGSINLGYYSCSGAYIVEKTSELFEKIVDKNLSVRRMYIVANHVIDEESGRKMASSQETQAESESENFKQVSIFDLMEFDESNKESQKEGETGFEAERKSIDEADRKSPEAERKSTEADERKQLAIQQAALEIKKKFGKNAILKGMNLEQGGTAIERNGQIGGHRG